VKVREVIQILDREGWHLDRQTGFHRQFRHADRHGTVTVAGKPSDECPGVLWLRYGGRPAGPEGNSVTEYVVVIEHEGDAWGAYVPDLPGCVAVGDSREEVEKLIAEAIPLHMDSLREHGESVPPPTTTGSTKVRVA
jgi:predicted RNase H-like HicB family nuclease/predicted RNA binding protein YcfA (HicA-like mRNA interferase family)